MERKNVLAISGVLAFLLAYDLLCLYSSFAVGNMRYYDLGLISDFLSNTAWFRGFFYASALDVNHLSYHFTPSLLLLVPFYRLFDSQFVLQAINVLATLGAMLGITILLDQFLRQIPSYQESLNSRSMSRIARWTPVFFLFLICTNQYTMSVMASAHFESLFTLLSVITLIALVRNASWPVLAALTTLTLGVRDDTGFHLFFILGIPFLLPKPLLSQRSEVLHKSKILAVVSLVYLATVVKVILPWLGTPETFHFDIHFRNFGNSWGELFWNVLTSPWQVAQEIGKSGFFSLYLTVLYLPVINPPLFLWTALPGVLFYIGTAVAKKDLWYYNSAFLLPGLFVSCSVVIFQLFSWYEKYKVRSHPAFFRKIQILYACLGCLVFLGTAVRITKFERIKVGFDFRIYPFTGDHSNSFPSLLASTLNAYPDISKVAADTATYVYLPNRLEKFLLSQYEKADLVIISRGLPLEQSEISEQNRITSALLGPQKAQFKLIQTSENYFLFKRVLRTEASG